MLHYLLTFFFYSYENEFLDNTITSDHRRLAKSFNLCYRYTDDLIVFNNKMFLDYLKEIYQSQLTVEKGNKSDNLADYLDLTFIIDSGGKLSTWLYDKRDDFDFHIVNFPFLYRNMPSGPFYCVYNSQSIVEKCFDIWGIFKMATVKPLEPGNNSFGINHIIRCRSKLLPLGFSQSILLLIL